ncbi:hypothetical protein [Campylobacter concisus]|uniref:hypothetical protein n=1 Tax=Campylobacter concisus TaxID=199 RepID=UPI000926DC1E|nr:hypothetical protein [Campylobacter concisus]OJJ29184.1 hypothetical protein TH67_01830 [Campylobacter concisus]
MPNKKIILNDLKIIRRNKKKEEIKQACIEVLFAEKATFKECKLLIENHYSVKLSNKEFSKWRKEYEATNANQPSDACHILVPNEDDKKDEELSNGTNNQE